MDKQTGTSKAMDAKPEANKQSSFKPTKPADISRPQSFQVPPPAPKSK